MNTVIIPVYNRPEFLEVTLDKICKADLSEEMFYIFAVDFGFDNRVLKVIKRKFPHRYEILQQKNKGLRLTKQSYNVLNGLLIGAKYTDKYVFLIEDDVFIGKDFFRLHIALNEAKQSIFCSIATRNHNTRYQVTDNPDAYYLSDKPDYQSLGVCHKKEIIETYIQPHFVRSYFFDPIRYCNEKFANCKWWIGEFFAEQDGLIRRILFNSGLKTAFPHVPRAFHAGFYGKNRNKSLHCSVAKIREITSTPAQMKKYCGEYYFDSQIENLETNFTKLINVTAGEAI